MEDAAPVEEAFSKAQQKYEAALQLVAELLVTYGDVYMDKSELFFGGFTLQWLGGGAAGRRFLLSPLGGGGRLLRHAKWPATVRHPLFRPKFWQVVGLGGLHLRLLGLAWGPRIVDTSGPFRDVAPVQSALCYNLTAPLPPSSPFFLPFDLRQCVHV